MAWPSTQPAAELLSPRFRCVWGGRRTRPPQFHPDDIGAIIRAVADILIRDLPDHVIAAIDATARRLGLSRNEYLRRRLAGTEDKALPVSVTADDLARSAATFSDLLDPGVMTRAWS